MRVLTLSSFCAVLLSLTALSQIPAAKSPPMGWNSWDAYGLTITEAQFRANSTVLKDKLLPFGWRYAVIDEGWFFDNPQDREKPDTLHYAIDPNGRYVPTPLRFPSAGKSGEASPGKLAATIESTSFAELSRWVHAQGLLFGIHIVRGVPRASVERNLPIESSSFRTPDAADTTDACPWDPTNWGVKDNAAGQAWYDSLLRQYAGWGVDLLKVDCISDHPYKAAEIRMIRRAIDKTGRSIVLSLSPGPTALEHAAEVSSLATMWRISDDFWDTWAGMPGKTFPQSIPGQLDRLKQWSELDLPDGHFPDADMLPLGELRPSPGWGNPRRTRLTPDEQRTVMTAWAINQSPLILGANLTLLDEPTLKLVTNREMLRIDQEAIGRGGQVRLGPDSDAPEKGPLRVWMAKFRRSGAEKTAVALFNLGDVPLLVDRSIKDLDLVTAAGPAAVDAFDVWTGQSLGRISRVRATVPPHGCLLVSTK